VVVVAAAAAYFFIDSVRKLLDTPSYFGILRYQKLHSSCFSVFLILLRRYGKILGTLLSVKEVS